MKTYKKNISQSIFDVCLQTTGAISSIFDFMAINNLTSIELTESGEYLIPPVLKPNVVEALNKMGAIGSIDSSFYPPIYVYQPETVRYMNDLGIVADESIYYPGTPQEITGEGLWMAIDQFVVMLKVAGTWEKMQVIYPFIGSSADSHSINLTSEAYVIDWFGGVIHNRFGVTFNGTTGYGNTNFNTGEFVDSASVHIAYFNRNNFGYGYLAGSANGYTPDGSLTISHDVAACYIWTNSDGFYSTSFDSQAGLFVHTRTDSTYTQIFKRSTDENFDHEYTKTLSAVLVSNDMFIGATNNSGDPQFFADCNLSFLTLGSGLIESDVDALDLALTTLNTALGRNI
jgi:hypothetical protein